MHLHNSERRRDIHANLTEEELEQLHLNNSEMRREIRANLTEELLLKKNAGDFFIIKWFCCECCPT
jgi:hypothetical protein